MGESFYGHILKFQSLKNIESELIQIKIEKNKLEKEIIHLRTNAVSDKEKHNFLLQANETLENRFKILATFVWGGVLKLE